MGRPLDTALELPAEIAARDAPAATLAALTNAAAAQRSDLKAMDRRVEAASSMVQAARAGFLPEVGVTGQYEMNKETFVGQDGSNWSVFVGAKWNAFDGGGARARTLRARAEQRAAAQLNALMHDAAGLEVRQAWYALEAAQQRVVIATGAVEEARAALAQVEDRTKEGLATIVELMGAQTALSTARTREVAARRDVLLGRATLDLATGSL
jgi:outer membrane protein TolC